MNRSKTITLFQFLLFLLLLSPQLFAQNCSFNPPLNINLTGTNLSCGSDSSGCIHASISGGSGNPLSLSWSNGENDVDSICNLPTGTYTLFVTDTFQAGGTVSLYQENFDGAHGWTLNVPTGTNGADNNFWVSNSNEAGMAPGQCATAGGNKTSLLLRRLRARIAYKLVPLSLEREA